MHVERFIGGFAQEALNDLRARILRTRWPDAAPGHVWEQGIDLAHLQQLLAYWSDGFDWRKQERWLNSLDHFHAETFRSPHPLRSPTSHRRK